MEMMNDLNEDEENSDENDLKKDELDNNNDFSKTNKGFSKISKDKNTNNPIINSKYSKYKELVKNKKNVKKYSQNQ
jgi:hypothetical protein